jgi:hypothetical protein
VNALAQRAVVALLVAASGAGGADDNHASTLAAVLVGRHVGDGGGCFGDSGDFLCKLRV